MIDSIEKSRILFLDTEPLIRLLQMHPDYYPAVSGVLDRVYEKNIQVMVSPVTLFEISQKAFAAGDSVLPRQYREFFENSANVNMVPVSGEVTVKAAELFAATARTNHKLTEAESFRLAAAYACGADAILTGNSAWKDLTDVAVFTLDDL